MTQCPTATNSAVPPESVQAPFELRSIDTTTGLPEPPPVAPMVYEPPTVGLVGGEVQTEIVCAMSPDEEPPERECPERLKLELNVAAAPTGVAVVPSIGSWSNDAAPAMSATVTAQRRSPTAVRVARRQLQRRRGH